MVLKRSLQVKKPGDVDTRASCDGVKEGEEIGDEAELSPQSGNREEIACARLQVDAAKMFNTNTAPFAAIVEWCLSCQINAKVTRDLSRQGKSDYVIQDCPHFFFRHETDLLV